MDAASSSDEHSKPPSWEGWSDDANRSFGLELQSPYAEYLVDGIKTIETRSYPLPAGLTRRRIDVLRSAGGVDGVSSAPDITALTTLGDESHHNSPSSSSSLERLGWCTFVRSFRYVSRREFEEDAGYHLVDSSSGYGWADSRPMYGWVVGDRGRHHRPSENDGDGDDNDDDKYVATRRFRSLFELTREGRRREGEAGGHDDDEKDKGATVLITGASGMLGRALHRLLLLDGGGPARAPSTRTIIGLGHTRLRVEHYHEHFPPPAGNDKDDPPREVRLESLDLLNFEATTDMLDKYRPDVIVHCAAERRPDYFERSPVESTRLNVDATRHLAKECARLGMEKSDGEENGSVGPYLIYVSTEYVFDGGSESGVYPPYGPGSATNPLNEYGRSKLEGERVVREILNESTTTTTTTTTTTSREVAEGGGGNASVIGRGGRGIIVRVPLLYGEDCRDLGESPALEMMEAFLPPAAATAAARTSTTKKTIDDWALRFPTSAEDVARVLKLLIDRILNGDFQSVDYAPSCPPRDVYHVSSPYGITKYELMRLQAMAMNIATSEVDERTAGDSSGPPKDSAPRPRCTQLDCGETWRALGSNGVELTYEFVSLERGMKRSLGGFPERFARM